MRQRLLQLMGVATTVVVVSLAMTTTSGQAPTSAQQNPAAKTSWGEPDLEGIWTDPFQTPLQRPTRYAGKETFTDQERAERLSDRVLGGDTQLGVASPQSARAQLQLQDRLRRVRSLKV